MNYFKQLGRRKYLNNVLQEDSELGKVLSLFDLTAIGVGSTLGVGIYVLPGAVAKDVAGPGVILSFFFAAVTSIFAGLCFAEFGARVPKAGSAYTYSYVAIGEFVAFIIGWSLILEYVIGAASVAKGLSVYLDSLLGHRMEDFYRSFLQIRDVYFLSEYVDLFAFAIAMIVTIGLATGLKESMALNNLLTLVNVSVVLIVIIVGISKADLRNWTLPEDSVPPNAGQGGFLPFGISGTIAGAATCFFGYVGFDCISASGEEVRNPQRAIPLAIILSLGIVFIAYFGVAAVLTLMWPYYLQDPDAPLPYAFQRNGMPWAQWTVSVGGIFGLLASLIAGLFPLPRIIYAMANDGLLFKILGRVHPKFQTPFVGTLLAGLATAVMAAVFKLKQLVDLMSICTLLVYTIVSACVLLLRYQNTTDERAPVTHEQVEQSSLLTETVQVSSAGVLRQMFNTKRVECCTGLTSAVVTADTLLICISSLLLSIIIVNYGTNLLNGDILPVVGLTFLIIMISICLTSIYVQPPSNEQLKFQVPFVPLIPGLSIFFNVYLMVLMQRDTWATFTLWSLAGFMVYFSYGIYHSSERRKNQVVEYQVLKTDDEEEKC